MGAMGRQLWLASGSLSCSRTCATAERAAKRQGGTCGQSACTSASKKLESDESEGGPGLVATRPTAWMTASPASCSGARLEGAEGLVERGQTQNKA